MIAFKFRNKIFLLNFPLQFVLILFMVFGCTKSDVNDPIEQDNKAPNAVSEVSYEGISGGAIIRYKIPSDSDLLYVMAKYELRDGVHQEVKSSFYNNSLIIKGFGDTKPRKVELIAVDRSGNASAPVSVEIVPLEPSVLKSFETLKYSPDFGGIAVSLKNESLENLVITILVQDNNKDWIEYDRYYSKLPEIAFQIRGFDSIPTQFGVYIKDRWNNVSDTLQQNLKPLFEEKLDKTKFKELLLPGAGNNTWTLTGLWDDNVNSFNGFRAPDNEGLPTHFNIDLGVTAKLSRFKTWQVRRGREYFASNTREFELWGSNDPAPDGSFDGWVKLGEYEVVKPSGLPPGELSDEDIFVANEGDDHKVSIDAPPVRYLRFHILSTFVSPRNSSTGGSWMIETTLWGENLKN